MDRELRLKFIEALSHMNGKDYMEAFVAFGAAPTIQGKKPSSLMIFNAYGKKDTLALWKKYRVEICERFMLERFNLRKGKNCLVVLLYRKKLLELYVNQKKNQRFLDKMGYALAGDMAHKLHILKSRFEKLCPHEVGIFLGMPVEDVEGFIKNKGDNFLFCKYWKVYYNLKRAKNLFSTYDNARKSIAEFVLQSKGS